MFKKPKSKILVFLLMLGILYGCKRQILDPLNPQKNLPQKVQFDKVKGFYENGRYKNKPKRTSGNGNERMTAADSARFKDFEPEWDKTEVELLPNNEKMLIVPVVRFLNVNYNQGTGFIRRLCIRVDANDDFLEANIVELIGNLTFVKNNYNAIFKNYKDNNIIANFNGVVTVYALNYDILTTKFYSDGIFKENTIIATQNVPANTQWVIICPRVFVAVWIPGICPNSDLPEHGTAVECSGGGQWETIVVMGECVSQGGIGGNSGSDPNAPTGNAPTGGGGTGTTIYEPITTPRPPKAYEIPAVVAVPTTTVSAPPRDPGVSWAYTLYGDTEATPEETALLKSLDSLSNGLGAVDRKDQMSPENKLLLAITLRELRNSSPAYEKMYQALRAQAQRTDTSRRSLVFKIRPVGAFGKGSFGITPGSPDLNEISIKATSLRDASVVAEEFLHALDTMVIRKNDPDVNNPNRVNYEFNVKVAMMMIARRDDGPEPHSLWQDYDVNGNIINPTIEQMRSKVEMQL